MNKCLLLSMPGGGEWIIILAMIGLLVLLILNRQARVVALFILAIGLLIGGIVGFNAVETHQSSYRYQIEEHFDESEAQQVTLVKSLSIGGIGIGIILLIIAFVVMSKRSKRREIHIIENGDPDDSDLGFAEELEKLHLLFEKGILTKEEFEIQKKKVLSRM